MIFFKLAGAIMVIVGAIFTLSVAYDYSHTLFWGLLLTTIGGAIFSADD